jgi:hypothetical protein
MLTKQGYLVAAKPAGANERDRLLQRRCGADFWPMTFILIVIVVASLVLLSRVASLFLRYIPAQAIATAIREA